MKAIVLDDEPLSSKQLLTMINTHCFEITSTVVYNVASKALEHLKTNEYDILFLDVEMPGMNGFEFLTHAELSVRTSVIFTTAYSQYAIEAFKKNAAHYLLKPIMEIDLITAVRRVSKRKLDLLPHKLEKNTITIYDGENYLILNQQDIIRLEADGNYTKVISNTHPPQLSSKRLAFYENLLDKFSFFRCHHSHIVNLNHIVKINKGKSGYVELSNQELSPVSKSRKDQLKSILGL